MENKFISFFTEKLSRLDWWLVAMFIVIVAFGWLNVYSSVHSVSDGESLVADPRSYKQLLWIGFSLIAASLIIFAIPDGFWISLSPVIYAAVLLLLVCVLFLGHSVNGSSSWIRLGPLSLQPAEFAKTATALLLAKYMSRHEFSFRNLKDFAVSVAIIIVPILLILMENETGSVLVLLSLVVAMYREGLSGWVLVLAAMVVGLCISSLVLSPAASVVICLGFVTLCYASYFYSIKKWCIVALPVVVALLVWERLYQQIPSEGPAHFWLNPMIFALIALVVFIVLAIRRYMTKSDSLIILLMVILCIGTIFSVSTKYLFDNVLKPHQQSRIEVLLGMKEDIAGAGYNVHQSLIAIGSGGFFGKGYLHGTQTTFGFVPEQTTDFIFCTVGEEWGFVGSALLVALYAFFIGRIIVLAERCRDSFTRIYGYCIAAFLATHFAINIGMTLGLMPIIGIPLPLVSYGGTSLLSFTCMIFIFIALESNEKKLFGGRRLPLSR